jgi:hypothetical protein
MKQAVFELKWSKREGGGGKTERDYLDFVVAGESLRDMLDPGDFIGCLGWGSEEIEVHQIAQLLLQEMSELSSGRIPIYICPECGDLHCGAVTVRVSKEADSFVWSDFAFETGCDDAASLFEKVAPFTFDKMEYWRALDTRRTEIAA